MYLSGNWETDGERMMVPGEQNMAAVLDLRPATTYHLRIVARNEIGDSEASDTVTIITAEEGEQKINSSLTLMFYSKLFEGICQIIIIFYSLLGISGLYNVKKSKYTNQCHLVIVIMLLLLSHSTFQLLAAPLVTLR